jgi:hypothetical protein
VARPDYGLIVGQGRSGTNWLLELFDLSPETFCRNEPYGASDSPLNDLLEHRWIEQPDQSLLEEHWDEAAQWTARHMGDRDPRVRVPKQYLYEPARRFGLYRAVHGPRLRHALSTFLPSLRGAEWAVPGWLGSPQNLEASLSILKLVTPPGWASFVLRHRPEIPVFHIIRHPGGFLNSWANRYLATQEKGLVRRENVERLRAVVAAEPRWAQLIGDIEAMEPDESELWYWRYANETIFRAGCGSSNYHRVIYEDLVSNPTPIMERLYPACGLSFTPKIRAAIEETTTSSSVIAANWRDRLSGAQQHLVERFAGAAVEFYQSAVG